MYIVRDVVGDQRRDTDAEVDVRAVSEFAGRAVLAEQKANGVKKKLVAFKMTDKAPPPRPHYPIWANGAAVGEVVSGTQSPSLNNGIGMGYVRPDCAVIGGKIEIEIRGRRFAAEVVKKPIYKPA